MKIMNKTYQEVREGESPIQKTPITGLASTDELPEGSLIHIVYNNGAGGYESKKMTTDTFKQKIYDAVQNTFKTSYWDTHEKGEETHSTNEEVAEGERPKGTSFKDLLAYLQDKESNKDDTAEYVPEEVPEADPNGFVDHIYYDFDVLKRYMVAKDNDIVSELKAVDARVDDLDCFFSPRMKLATTKLDNNIEVVDDGTSVNYGKTENDDYCQMSIEPGNKISNEWTCPAAGNLVVYGWLDSSNCLNNKATPSAFCAIEGNINDNWEVISVCPVAAAKGITYVGFNLMVKKDLTIRARTGFTCGAKSGQFSNEQDGYDTLANSTANGFKCMIYHNETEDESEDTDDNT